MHETNYMQETRYKTFSLLLISANASVFSDRVAFVESAFEDSQTLNNMPSASRDAERQSTQKMYVGCGYA